MKTRFELKRILIFSLAFSVYAALAHEVPVHRAITLNAAASALNKSSAYKGFVNTVSADVTLFAATNSMIQGSAEEDDTPQQDPKGAGGNRSYNHFYDPLDITYGKGLSDIPQDIRGIHIIKF